MRRRLKRINLCECGCGEESKYLLNNGKRCCENHTNKCPVKRNQISENRKGKCLGDENPAKRPEVRDKISKAKTGFEHTEKSKQQMKDSQDNHFASDKGKKQAKRHSKRMSGKNHPFYGKKRPKQSKIMSGKNNPMKRPEVAVKCGLKGDKNPAKRPDVRERISKTQTQRYMNGVTKSGSGKSGHFFSKKNNKEIHYRSSYELMAYKLLEQMYKVKSYNTEPFSIQYEYQNINRYTIPDILITYTDGSKELVEVKAKWNIYTEKEQHKLYAMWEYANDNNMDFSVWTEDELLN